MHSLLKAVGLFLSLLRTSENINAGQVTLDNLWMGVLLEEDCAQNAQRAKHLPGKKARK